MQLLVEILSSFATLPPHSRAQLGCAEELYLKIDSPTTNIVSAVLPHIRKSCSSCWYWWSQSLSPKQRSLEILVFGFKTFPSNFPVYSQYIYLFSAGSSDINEAGGFFVVFLFFQEPKLPFYLVCHSSACTPLLFHVVIHLSWHSASLRVCVHLCGFHFDGSWSCQGGAVAKISISLTPLRGLVTPSLFLFGFTLLRCCVLHQDPKKDHSFFVLST